MIDRDAFAAFRERNFRIYCVSLFTYGISTMMLPAIISLQVYDLTGSATKLGIIGLIQFGPTLVLAFFAGAVADKYDRRRISQIAQSVGVLCAAALAYLNATGDISLSAIYIIIFFNAIAGAFDFPARGALLPMLVERDVLPKAIMLSGTIRQLGFVIGPTVGALLIGVQSYSAAYVADLSLISISVFAMFFLRPRTFDVPKRAISLEGIREGIAFVWNRKIIFGCMTLDMFAVIFGGATALLPVYADEILEISKLQTGFLYAALDGGALLMSIYMIAAPVPRKPGVWLMWTVLAFGVVTVGFGLSRSYYLSMLLYALIGMSDQVSVVMRNTVIQLNTPDELRGRVGSVNSLFIGASNRLGQAESGFVAGVTSATFAVVSGGIGCVAVLGAVWATIPEMRRYTIRRRGDVEEVEPPKAPAST